MPGPDEPNDLTALFQQLGARDPATWAASQASEGIPQLHRFLFLRQAWQRVIPEDRDDWIDREQAAAAAQPTQPFAGVGQALGRLLAAGASREDIVDLVRGMQAQLLFELCYLLEDPGLAEPAVEDVGWALVATDDDLAPTSRAISGLHESVLETDPTGREMRPRPGR